MKSLQETKIQLQNLKQIGVKINIIYLTDHGSKGKSNVGYSKTPGTNTDITEPNEHLAFLSTSSVSASYIEEYNKIQKGLSSKKKSERRAAKERFEEMITDPQIGPEIMGGIKDLQEIASHIEDGGTLILGSCLTGFGEEGIRFIKALGDLTGNRLNILLNQDKCIDVLQTTKSKTDLTVIKEEFLDVGRTGNFFKGWIKMNPKGEIQNLGNIQLNSSGEPVTEVKKP